MEEQGYKIDENILYQDHKNAILLEKNGKMSAGKQSHALNVWYFLISDTVDQGNLNVQYCPTNETIGDFMTKPQQGSKFQKFQKAILDYD